jgi:hypothetical protein
MSPDRRSSLRRMADLSWSRSQYLRAMAYSLPSHLRGRLFQKADRLHAFGNRCGTLVWKWDNRNVPQRPKP